MDNKYIILTFLTLTFAFWILWLPGIRVATDYHLIGQDSLKENFYPWIWRETNVSDGLGQYTVVTLWSQPLHAMAKQLNDLLVHPSYQTKILVLISLLLGYFSMLKLISLEIEGAGKYIGAFFYLTNTFFILMIDGGQISLSLAYSILPLCVYLLIQLVRKPTFKRRVYLGLSLLLLSIFDIRIIYFFLLISLIFIIFEIWYAKKGVAALLKELFLSCSIIAFFLFVFHMYWLLPVFFTKPTLLPQTYERVSQVNFLSFSTLPHSLLLQQPHWHTNIFGKVTPPRFEFIFIPFLVFLACFKRKSKFIMLWLTIAVLGIFFSKGSNNPVSEIYPNLFKNIPLFSLFRDPVKFYFLICISYSILIGLSVNRLTSLRFENYILRGFTKLVPYLILIYLFFLIRPVYLNQMTGLFSIPPFEFEYQQLASYISQDNNFSRIFWIPTKKPLGFTSSIHPAVEAAGFAQKRPFAVGTKGTYEIFNFLREAPYMGEIFDVAGIGYIAYPYLDQRRDDLHPDNIRYYYTFSDQLSKRAWLSKVEISKIPLFKTKNHQDRFFIAPNIWWVIGSDSIYAEATKSANLKLAKNSLIFAEEYSDLGQRIDELPEAKISLNNKTLIDVSASLVERESLIFPAKQLDFDPDESGWWKREAADLIRWRDFLYTKYGIDNQDFDLGGGWAVGEKNLKLKVTNEKIKKDKILLARVMESSRSGSLKFYQDNQLIGEVSTKISGNGSVRWFEIGRLSTGKSEISIDSEGDLNVINALAILDGVTWQQQQVKVKEWQTQGRIVEFDDKHTQEFIGDVTYKKINPTKYQVSVQGLTRPAFLVFSQNFDRLWKLDGEESLPIYSLLNGFKIDQDGNYIVEFEAQKYVYPGLIATFVTIIILLLLLIKYKHS